jgi:phosphonate transport system substrate-binding protein
MAEVTGKNVQFFPVQSNAAQIEAMRAGRLHVAGFNTGSNPLAVACAGFRPFAMMAAEDGSFGYEMEIITYPGSGHREVEDIRGQQMAFTSETSNSGFKAPPLSWQLNSAWWLAKTSSGLLRRSRCSILGVANQDYPAADCQLGPGSHDRARCRLRGPVRDDLHLADLPDDRLRHGLQPDARAAGGDPGSVLQLRLGRQRLPLSSATAKLSSFPITFQDDWAVIRTIDEANGVVYECN